MAKRSTKEVVISNIKTLMDMNGDSTYALAKRSGIAQSTIVNILSGRHKVSIDATDAIAAAYGLDGWHLLMPNLPIDIIQSPALSKLIAAYLRADQRGRDYIDSVAAKEAQYAADE